ncbi:hypothetical protein HSBAA_04020 [Vreelandella sulfidaeris]|uniref:PAS domain-containing protein n=1 Tax=Vreelandella sulfidaeris TaxID=115553 RepID=A0A455TZX0_9GAMM|nr:hypothetical protein HSBAA_04020 [Halomonas sulfidaeris]
MGQHFESAMQGKITRFELSIYDRDGQQHLLDLIALPININNNVAGIYGIAQDVTTSRAQQTQLRTLERSVEASVNGVLIADANLPDMPIVYANRAFSVMTGYTQEDVIGKNCRFLQGVIAIPLSSRKFVAILKSSVMSMSHCATIVKTVRRFGTTFMYPPYVTRRATLPILLAFNTIFPNIKHTKHDWLITQVTMI